MSFSALGFMLVLMRVFSSPKKCLDLTWRRVCVCVCADEAEDPACIPIYWVSKWVDYSDKYGLGYQLCDNSVGVLFNDSTRLILLANGE